MSGINKVEVRNQWHPGTEKPSKTGTYMCLIKEVRCKGLFGIGKKVVEYGRVCYFDGGKKTKHITLEPTWMTYGLGQVKGTITEWYDRDLSSNEYKDEYIKPLSFNDVVKYTTM